MSRLAMFLLGSPRIERDAVPVHISRRKAIALLAYLAVTGQRHRRDALAALLWPEHDQSHARAGLRRALSALKDALSEGWLDADRETVALNGDAEIQLDVRDFHEQLAGCQQHDLSPQEDCHACLSMLDEAVALYRGNFMAGFTLRDSAAFDDWQFFQGQGLRDELAGALERLVQGHSVRREFEPAIAHARRWLELDPLHEPAHRALMQLYARSGQRAAALRQYQECERILQEELGAEPEEETAELYRAILERCALPEETTGDGRTTEDRRRTDRRHNLPAQLTLFIGRETQLAELREMLNRPEVRLVTLTGAGGTGKTRLALQVAAGLLDHFSDGVFFAALASIRDPAHVVSAIAGALGVQAIGEDALLESVKFVLQTKDLLLLLDNFEHVSKAAPVVSELLASAPSLVVLVTSRAPLHIYAEHTYAVPPMTIPHPLSLPSIDRLAEAEAVQLFVQRARQVRPDFALDTENAEAVAKICERLDGLPLAIELAAARVRLFAPQAIASHLGNSFAFLAGGPRDLPARQRTLRATIEWSYDLLDEGARQLFRRLAVFAGGFTLAAAQAVALDAPSSSAGSSSGLAPSPPGPPIAVLEPIESLVDQHLIQVSDVGGEPRFTMLEMIREYALEQLVESGETKATQQRHAGYFLALAENAEPALYGPKVAEWMDRLEVEYDNMRVALAWSIDSNSEVALRLAGALGRFWSSRGPLAEGRDWLAAALAAGASGGPDLDRWRAKALDGAGDLARILGDHGAARALFSESVTLCRKVGEVRDLAWSLGSLGNLLTGHSPDEARLLLEEAMVLFRQVDDIVGLAMVSLASSTIFLREGEYEKASASVEKGLTLAQEGGVIVALDWASNVLGRIACRQGNYAAARASFEESLAFGRQVRDRASGGVRLCDIGFTWYLEGHYAQAKRHYEEGLQIHRQVGVRTRVAETLARLGYVALRQGCWQEAQARLSESLALCQEVRPAYESGVVACLIGYAALAEVQAQLEQAARLLGAAETLQRPSEYLRSDPYPVEYEHVASALHSQLDKVTLDAAWNEGRAMTLEQAVACALEQGIAS